MGRQFGIAGVLAVVSMCGALAAHAANDLVIGTSLSLSGQYSASAEYQLQGYQSWVDDVNQRGGLLGRKVQLKYYDDRSDPATGVRLYEKLIVEDKVNVIMGPYSSPVTASTSAIAEKYKMMMIAPLASANSIWERGFKYTFQFPTASDLLFTAGVDLAAKRGIKVVAILGEDSGYPRTALPPSAELAKKNGMRVVDLGYYPKGTKDFSASVIRAKSEGAEMILCGCYAPDSIQLTRQIKDANFNAKMYLFGVGPALPEFKAGLGPDSDYIMGADHWATTVTSPGNREFVERFTKKYNREPNYHAAAAYGSMQILEMAIKSVGVIDQDKLRNYVAGLDTTTIYGRFKVDKTGAQVGKLGFIVQWQKGVKRIVWPAEGAEAAPVVPAPNWSSR